MDTITIEKTRKNKQGIFREYDEKNTFCQEKIELITCDNDFEKAYASAMTEDELRQRMYMRIDAWKWNEK